MACFYEDLQGLSIAANDDLIDDRSHCASERERVSTTNTFESLWSWNSPDARSSGSSPRRQETMPTAGAVTWGPVSSSGTRRLPAPVGTRPAWQPPPFPPSGHSSTDSSEASSFKSSPERPSASGTAQPVMDPWRRPVGSERQIWRQGIQAGATANTPSSVPCSQQNQSSAVSDPALTENSLSRDEETSGNLTRNVRWLANATFFASPSVRLSSPHNSNRNSSRTRPILGRGGNNQEPTRMAIAQPLSPLQPVPSPRPATTRLQRRHNHFQTGSYTRFAVAPPRSAVFCGFCKKNGETPEFYSTHKVKDPWGRVVCPVLRNYTCPNCGLNGDKAHTLQYCPYNQ